MTRQTRVLIIDDDPLFRSLLVSVLRKDYLVGVAKEGSEGFHAAILTPPDVAIIDVNMPGWDGLRTVRAFRQHHATMNCPILMLTGDASRETVLASIRAGANEYLIKSSFSRPELRRKLATLLASVGIANDSAEPTAKQPLAAAVSSQRESVSATSDRSGSVPGGSASAVDVPKMLKESVGADELQAAVDNWE